MSLFAMSIIKSHSLSLSFLFISLLSGQSTFAFDNSRYDNLAVYWGQNSYGAVHSDDPANWQKRLSFYCGDDTLDAIPVAFLNVFFGTGGAPSINLANTCNPTDNATFPGTNLPDCSALAADVKTCQAQGKIVTMSLGGATGSVGFQSDSQAETFADTVWNDFLGGTSSTRPFGDAILDGVDLDIESGGSSSYAAFVNRIRSHASGASKKYYVTAAPQCPYPDSALGAVLNAADFDAVYVQFYNNVCGLNNFNTASNWDFGLWDNWARTVSPNPNVKVYIGAPASSTAAGSGYLAASGLANNATQMRKSFPSFGGVMLWDASQAWANNNYQQAIKNALVAAGGTGFTFPACSAPAYASGQSYTGGQQVSYQGYIWQAKWFSDQVPTNDPNNDWSAISACSGGSVSSPTSTTPVSSTPSTSTSASATSTSSPATGGSCAGVAAWSSGVAYTAGQQAVYSGQLWTANYWTEGDPPNTVNGDWTDKGACTSSAQAVVQTESSAPAATFSPTAVDSSGASDESDAAMSATASASTVKRSATAEPGRIRSRFFRY